MQTVTLREFLATHYPHGYVSLSKRAAALFNVPYPLTTGWHHRHANNTADAEAARLMGSGKKGKPRLLG